MTPSINHAIRLAGDDLVFTASHAIRFLTGEVEAVHEHCFRVRLTLSGPLNPAGYVADFIAATHLLRQQLEILNGRTWIAEAFNPTAENLATLLLERFRDAAVKERLLDDTVEKYGFLLELEEEPGMWSLAEIVPENPLRS